ncbi:MAG TPA: hypothetical protein VHO25_06630 [Polyangiaceae bacterium]|nr:hypothetical protein [Polyangiaceae bacterium]
MLVASLSLLTAVSAFGSSEAIDHSREPPPVAAPAPAADPAITPAQRALAASLSLVPGLVLHGAGNFALGRRDTAYRLLAAEGVGIGLLGTGGAILVLTGAARDWVAPAALLGVAGAGLFTTSWLLDIYSVWAPDGGFGTPSELRPWLVGSLGYAHVYDPQFAYRNFLVSELEARIQRVSFDAELWASPDDENYRTQLTTTLRALGQTGDRRGISDGSALDVRLELGRHSYAAEQFSIMSVGWAFRGRLDLFHYDRFLAGTFAELEAGHAQQVFQWSAPAVSSNEDLLLLRFGLGSYLGNHEPCGGEIQLYYDHRHDGYAAGLLVPGLGSGVLGHVGLEGEYYWSETIGAGLLMEAGSAYVTALSVKMRAR